MKTKVINSKRAKGFFTLLVCWMALLLPRNGSAQATCVSSISIISGTQAGNLSPNGNLWFSFTGNSLSNQISVYPATGMSPPFNLPVMDTVQLYSGSCGTLTSVAVITNSTGVLSVRFPALTLTTGTTYFLRVHTSCTGCTGHVRAMVVSNFGESICDANCELNCNGSLENVTSTTLTNPSQAAVTSCWDVVYEPSFGMYTDIPSVYYNGTPDLFSTNCTTSFGRNFCVPNNENGSAASYSGTGYAGVFAYQQYLNQQSKDYREYLQQELCHKMIQGHKYRVSFRAQLADSSAWATRLSVMLMDTILIQGANANNVPGVFDSLPPAYVTPGFVTSMTAWQLFSFVYTATSDHKQIAIGNFKNDSAQYRTQLNNHLHREWVSPLDIRYYYMSYYYLDSVNVVPLDEIVQNADTLYNCLGQLETLNASLTSGTPHAVYTWSAVPSDQSLINWQSSWNVLHPNVPDTQVVVHPNVSTMYFVTVTDTLYHCTFLDTFFVQVANTSLDSLKGNTAKCDLESRYILYQHPVNPNLIYSWHTTTGDLVQGNGNDSVKVNWIGSLQLDSWLYVNATDTLAGCSWKDSILVQACCVADTGRVFYNDTASKVLGINPGIISNRSFNINGTFWIDENMTFVGCNFNMAPNSNIITYGGHKVLFQADSLKAGCCEMWDGVIIQSVNDTVLMEGYGYLGDAVRGIVSNNGGVYTVSNHVTFNRNLNSITVKPFAGIHGGTVREALFTSVSTNYCPSPQGKLLPPYAGQWPLNAITATGVNSITFGNPALANYANVYTNLLNGIRTKLTNSVIYNNKFISVDKSTSSKAIWCVGRFPTVFPVVNLTQYSVTVGGTQAFQKNTFQDCPYGVYTDTAMSTTVLNNRFNQSYSTSNPVSLRGVAVQINHCTGFGRTVNVTGDTIANHRINVSLNQNNRCVTTVTKNFMARTVNGTTTCTGVYQVCNGTNIGATTIATNVMRNVQYGVRLSNVKNAVVNQNLIYVRPTATPYIGAVRAVMAQNCTQLYVIQNQLYKENPTATITSNWVGGIYIANCANSVVDCNSINNIGYGILYDGSGSTNSTVFANEMYSTYTGIWLRNGAMISQQGNSVIPTDNTWQGAITNRLYTSGITITNGNFSPFFYRNSTPNNLPMPSIQASGSISIPVYATPANASTALTCSYVWHHSIAAEQNAQIALGQIVFRGNEVAGQWLSRESLYRTILEDSTVISGDSILTSFKDSADQANIGILTAAMEVHSNGGMNSQSEMTSAYKAVSLIIPNDNIEANYQTVETIMLDHEVNGGEFTGEELEALRYIAQLCPFTDGNAVYIARGLLAPIDSLEYESSCETGESSNRMSVSVNETSSPFRFKLFPNPNTGNFSIDYELGENETGVLEIFSITGVPLYTIPLVPGQNINKVMYTDLGAGTYLYKVSVNGEMKLADKLIVIIK